MVQTIASIIVLSVVWAVPAQTTTFNYQGRLNDGTKPANGHYDLQFKLFDAITGGSQVGATLDRPNVALVNGVFSTTLDFGASSFNGSDRFIEISVRPNGNPNPHVILGARQQILSVPLAIRATSAANANSAQTAVNAQNAANAAFASTADNSLYLGGVLHSNYARLNFPNQGDLIGANVVSNGSLSVQGNLVAASVGSNGPLSVQGNATQPIVSNGLPKAMLAVTANGTIVRCYNGITGSSTGNCGFNVVPPSNIGLYQITFPFQISDRFWLVGVDAYQPYTERVRVGNAYPNGTAALVVYLTEDGTYANLPFHIFLF